MTTAEASISPLALAFMLLAACGGGDGSPPQVTVGGTVSGLAGSGLVLTDNGIDPLTVPGNGQFTFAKKIPVGSTYRVDVQTQPTSQTCAVTNGSGTAGNADITTVSVTCTTLYTIGGTAAGIGPVAPLTLIDEAGSVIELQGDGPFTFDSPVPRGTAYSVAYVGALGGNATCSVQNATGVVVSSNVTNVLVTCTVPTYTGQITVSGLTGAGLVLNVGGETLAISNNATVPFPAGVDGRASVVVTSQPTNPDELCIVGSYSVVPGTNLLYSWPVTCGPYIYTLGGTVSGLKGTGLVLSYNGTGTVAVNSNGAFLFGSPLLAPGEAYSVSVSTQPGNPTQYCIVQNADGTMASANVTSVSVLCSAPRFAYGAGGHANAVFSYTVDAGTGALTPVTGSPFPAGDSTSAVAVDPGTHFLFAANQGATGGSGSNTISAYTIDANTGALTAVAGSPFPSAAAPISALVDPGGRYLYVANVHDNTISAFAINPGNGALTAVAGGPAVPGLDGPRQLLAHPGGKFLYLAAANESKIWAYALDPGSGALTPLAGSPSSDFVPAELAIDPSGTPLYALTEGHSFSAEGIIGFARIDPVTGEAGPFGGGDAVSSNGIFPNTFALDASGHFLYLASQSVSGQGQLDYSAAPYTYPARPFRSAYSFPTPITSVTADPSGKFLFLLNPTGDALAYTIDSATGALTPAATTPSAFSPQQPIVITKQ